MAQTTWLKQHGILSMGLQKGCRDDEVGWALVTQASQYGASPFSGRGGGVSAFFSRPDPQGVATGYPLRGLLRLFRGLVTPQRSSKNESIHGGPAGQPESDPKAFMDFMQPTSAWRLAPFRF